MIGLRRGSVAVVVWLVAAGIAAAGGSFSGVWRGEEGGEEFLLTLEQDASGAVRGQLVGEGTSVRLEGTPEGPGIRGMALVDDEGAFGFSGRLDEDGNLRLELVPLDPWGNPVSEEGESILFTPASGGERRPAADDPGTAGVYINRTPLSAEQVRRLEEQYQTRIAAGRYWYDARCGAWGVEGGPTLGFVVPGLDLPGPMPADISGRGTAIFINGREIHVQDQMALQQLFGVTIPGRYWLDAQGNLGPEGGMAIANLQAAMQAAAGRQYGSVTGVGGTVASDGEGGYMFSARTGTGKSIFWSN